MKKLLVIPLLLAVVGCQPVSKYGSKRQAETACRRFELEEERKGRTVWCEEEDETRQILAETSIDDPDISYKIIRNFYY
tara:strand:- start:1089 stop:1325 length:237 start_codon:yes stop_codon:yes gene_type:complete